MTVYNVIREDHADGVRGEGNAVSVSVRAFYGEDDARRYLADKWRHVPKPGCVKVGEKDGWLDLAEYLEGDGLSGTSSREWTVKDGRRGLTKWTQVPCDVVPYGGHVIPFAKWSRDFLFSLWPHAEKTVVEECSIPDVTDLTKAAVRFSRRYHGSYVHLADASEQAVRYGADPKTKARFDLDLNLVVYGNMKATEGDTEDVCN